MLRSRLGFDGAVVDDLAAWSTMHMETVEALVRRSICGGRQTLGNE